MSEKQCSYNNLNNVTFHKDLSTTTEEVFNDLDNILIKLEESPSKYQIKNYIFILIPALFSSIFTLSYIFTARNLNYRCRIPQCDSAEAEYNPVWLRNAVPYVKDDDTPSRCERFRSAFNITITSDYSTDTVCPVELFNHNLSERCDDFVFDSEKVTILNEFGLFCEENIWKLTMPGTLSSIGYFIGLPFYGILSDRFGRRKILLNTLIFSAIVGFLRSFSSSFNWFLTFEFFDSFLGAGAYDSGFILGVEFVSPKKRVLMSSLINCCYPVAEALVGTIAWLTNSWRSCLRFIYVPGFMFIAFFWLTPESIKWLMSNGQHEEVKVMLRKAAKENDIDISEYDFENLEYKDEDEDIVQSPLKNILKSPILILRLLNCSFCWIASNFVHAGMSMYAVEIAGNVYLNYILVSLIEIPAYFATYITLDRFGRRLTMCGSFLLTGMACLAFIFIHEDIYWLRLLIYMLGKFSITIAFSVIYVLTTEIFPTPLRNSLFSVCALMGNIGSMPVPQVPLMSEFMESLPLILFSSLSLSSGFLALLFPETLNKKLPDTIEEAENLRKAPQLANQYHT